MSRPFTRGGKNSKGHVWRIWSAVRITPDHCVRIFIGNQEVYIHCSREWFTTDYTFFRWNDCNSRHSRINWLFEYVGWRIPTTDDIETSKSHRSRNIFRKHPMKSIVRFVIHQRGTNDNPCPRFMWDFPWKAICSMIHINARSWIVICDIGM